MKAVILNSYNKKGNILEIKASIDSIYSLDEVNDALDKVSKKGSKGKTILKISK